MFETPDGTPVPEAFAWCAGLQAIPLKAAAGAKTVMSSATIWSRLGFLLLAPPVTFDSKHGACMRGQASALLGHAHLTWRVLLSQPCAQTPAEAMIAPSLAPSQEAVPTAV